MEWVLSNVAHKETEIEAKVLVHLPSTLQVKQQFLKLFSVVLKVRFALSVLKIAPFCTLSYLDIKVNLNMGQKNEGPHFTGSHPVKLRWPQKHEPLLLSLSLPSVLFETGHCLSPMMVETWPHTPTPSPCLPHVLHTGPLFCWIHLWYLKKKKSWHIC